MEKNETKNIENVQEKKINGIGIASFVCAMVGIFFLRVPCGVAAIVTGIIGLAKFDREKEKGNWMNVVGICVGIFDILLAIMFFLFFSFRYYNIY